MADNSTQQGNDTIATDDITTLNGGAVSGVKAQRMKVGFGSDASLRDVDTQNPLPVGGGFVSTANSSTTNITGGAAFTGTSEDISQYASITVNVFSSHASATNGLSIQQSVDGTNWDITDVYTIPASTGKTFGVQATAKFYRIVYTNGATTTTSFRLQTIFHSTAQNSSSVRPQDLRPNDNDMAETLSYMMAYDATTDTWSRVKQLNGGISITGGQPASATSASWTSGTALNTASTVNISGYNTISLALIQGSTITAGIVTFEVSMDNANWLPISLNRIDAFTNSTTYALQASTNMGWTGSVDAFNYFRVRLSTVISGTGTVALAMIPQSFPVEPTVTIGQSNPALLNATVVGSATANPTGLLVAKVLAAISTNATLVLTGPRTVYGWHLVNISATPKYVRFYNKATAPTTGTDSPMFVIALPAGGGAVLTPGDQNIGFPLGFGYAITGAAADLDNTSTALYDVVGTIWYK